MTKKISLLIAAMAFLAISVNVFARITGTQPTSADIFCTGPDGAEVCVDASGNIVPTTTNDASAGTSSLRFSNVYSTLGNFSGAITGTSLSLTTGLPTASIADSAITSPKLASTAVTSGKIAGMNSGTASSGKIACWKDNGEGGYCYQISSINSTGCDLCY